MTALLRLVGQHGPTYVYDVSNVMVHTKTLILVIGDLLKGSSTSAERRIPIKQVAYFSIWSDKE